GEYPVAYGDRSFAKYIPNSTAAATVYSTNNNVSGNGVITISSKNEDAKTLSGNFNFTAYKANAIGNRTITEGRFANVPYTYLNDGFFNVIKYSEAGEIIEPSIVNIIVEENDNLKIEGITYSENTSQIVSFYLTSSIEVGEYNIGAEELVSMEFRKMSIPYEVSSGWIKITENDLVNRKMSAEFNFTYNFIDENENIIPTNVTDGMFSIIYGISE
ncbi:DUF6252 family protein, partial [Bacteroidales bacterium OttesenSCG-928-I21]|nr:DUF6252 family protein [Bacteroidales bacterium OttesenSCG-928-I21]